MGRPHGTLTLSLKDLEQSGIAGCMIRFPTLMLLERMLLSSALATNSHTMSTCLIILFGIWIIQQFPSELGRSAGDIYVLLAISKSMVDHLVQNCCVIHESIC